jgi:ATP synthase protein I
MTPEDDDDALKSRLDKLGRDLKSVRPAPTVTPLSSDRSANAAWSLGMKASSEFVAAVVIGGAIGWGLDWLMHTRPLFTIVFFMLGVAAGVWGVIRSTSPKGGS